MKKEGLSTRHSLFIHKMFQDFLILKKHFGLFFLVIYLYKILIKMISFLDFYRK